MDDPTAPRPGPHCVLTRRHRFLIRLLIQVSFHQRMVILTPGKVKLLMMDLSPMGGCARHPLMIKNCNERTAYGASWSSVLPVSQVLM
jgi:hypothetical protein